jgi:outer membrane protein assembly factor BamB
VTKAMLQRLGWAEKKPPADVLAALEQARLSDERKALEGGRELSGWINAWRDDHLDTDQKRSFGALVVTRLKLGAAALDLPVLDRLATVIDKPFADEAAVDAWFDEHDIPEAARTAVKAKFRIAVSICDDMVLCLDADTGKTVWKKVFPNTYPAGVAGRYSTAGSTPCVADGKCYVMGMDGAVYCLNAETGDVVWQGSAPGGSHSSFAVVDGVAAVAGDGAIGFDVRTGDRLWVQPKVPKKNAWHSPALWRHNGKAYLIFRGLYCLDPKTGEVIWSAPDQIGGKTSSPTVIGDRMAVWNVKDVVLYSLSPTGAQVLWKQPFPADWGASPIIYDGRVYALGGTGGICINEETGNVVWHDKAMRFGTYASPVAADRKIFMQGNTPKGGYGDGSLVMFEAAPGGPKLLAKADIKQTLTTSPAFVDGRLYCRLKTRIACYDLRK